MAEPCPSCPFAGCDECKFQCRADGCENPRHGTSRLCSMHEWRLRKHGSFELPEVEPSRCSVNGCEGTYQAKGLCQMHYSRVQRTGTTERKPFIEDVFWSYVTVGAANECWPWNAARNPDGYGRIGKRYAHRIACEREHGPPPAGLVVLHSCDNPPCVNPAHLSWGTQSQNVADCYARGRR